MWSQAGLGGPTWDPTKAWALKPLGKQFIVEGARENPHASKHSTAGRGEGTRYRVPNVAVSLVKHTLMDRASGHMQH